MASISLLQNAKRKIPPYADENHSRLWVLWHPENPGEGRIELLCDVLPVPGLQPKDQVQSPRDGSLVCSDHVSFSCLMPGLCHGHWAEPPSPSTVLEFTALGLATKNLGNDPCDLLGPCWDKRNLFAVAVFCDTGPDWPLTH